DIPAKEFGRVSHLPAAQLTAVIDGMRARGLVGADGWLTAAGRATKQRVEALTDRLAQAPYNALSLSELDRLVADLEPISAAIQKDFPWQRLTPSTPMGEPVTTTSPTTSEFTTMDHERTAPLTS